MGDGYQSHRVILDEAADYWRMGPGSERLQVRSRRQRIDPPMIQVSESPSVDRDRFFVLVHMAKIPGSASGSVGVRLGPYTGHAAAYRAAEKFVDDVRQGRIENRWWD